MRKVLLIFLAGPFLILVLTFFPVHAQSFFGQYEDEAPLGTWNIFGIPSAASLGFGETKYAFAEDCACSLSNPALLNRLSSLTILLNASLNRASLFKYGIINTGVLYTERPLFQNSYQIDFIGASLKLKNWSLALSLSSQEIYSRPSADIEDYYRQVPNYRLKFQQKGRLLNINLSLCRKLGETFSMGLGLNYITGYMDRTFLEERYSSQITISDDRHFSFRGFYINGGLSARLTSSLTVAAVFRTPHEKKAESDSLIRFSSPLGGTDIPIKSTEFSTFSQPLILGLGMGYQISDKLQFGSDVSYFRWADYEVKYFGEERPREFRNTVKISSGIEYKGNIKIFKKNLRIPLRAGIIYDPQPMKKPKSYYFSFSLGIGIQVDFFHIDVGAKLGKEKGSGENLTAQKYLASIGIRL